MRPAWAVHLLTTHEAAAAIGVCPNTVRALADRGILTVAWGPSARGGSAGRWFYPGPVEHVRRDRRILARRHRACRFCGRSIPQQRAYCSQDACRKRRQRQRYRTWRQQHVVPNEAGNAR